MTAPHLRVIHSSGEPGTGIYRHEDGRSEEFQRPAGGRWGEDNFPVVGGAK